MAYGRMAEIYDHLMNHAPYDKWVDFTEEIIRSSDIDVKRIADLGCGTGEITTRLATKGYEMVGVDYSAEMLSYAEHKSSTNMITIDWLHQDIRELSGLTGYDLAISYCDVINYITEPADISQTFQHVFDMLKRGGLFLFDVHHLPFIMDFYVNETFAEVTDEVSYIWFCIPGEEVGEMYHDLTFYYLQDGKYERFDEEHHQRTFSIKFYKEILQRIGFENVKVYADFEVNDENIDDDTARIFFSATKGPR
ncbi:class I SAM-dependent DNA methyltransferase [Oceanobacillus alkalisoli]|uniref:class I SAM-dependent DNA methyltransferase n=1 Tax=Oceanobacillus alkalisoli TaxID=2925113 RepID=UPI001EE3F200|nr:class I SAM-dependent methyltransferase [Oceanobacillus alkalisoli]MCG5103108.1 class I SAM-dependent methyltransferase [Oceanobacillus alkalisoli]